MKSLTSSVVINKVDSVNGVVVVVVVNDVIMTMMTTTTNEGRLKDDEPLIKSMTTSLMMTSMTSI